MQPDFPYKEIHTTKTKVLTIKFQFQWRTRIFFSQGITSSEAVNEAQRQAFEQPMAKPETQEKEDMHLLPAICFLEQHFQFRHNVLSGIVEYKKNGANDIQFQPLTNAGLNTLIIKAKVDMPEEANMKPDIKTYLESDMIPLHDPVKEYLDSLPKWDGVDRIADFWKRIPSLSDEKVEYLHIWHLSTVVHWMGKDEEHGNEMVPLFIGNQGCDKSTFCLHILPSRLRRYYLDHFNLGNKNAFKAWYYLFSNKDCCLKWCRDVELV